MEIDACVKAWRNKTDGEGDLWDYDDKEAISTCVGRSMVGCCDEKQQAALE